MKNGSIEFVAVFVDRFLHNLKPYINYEYYDDGEDKGLYIRETTRNIIKLSEDKKLLKEERNNAKELRKKILGIGNTSDSYKNNYSQNDFYARENDYFKTDNWRTGNTESNDKKIYDNSNNPNELNNKIGEIFMEVEKKDEILAKKEPNIDPLNINNNNNNVEEVNFL